MDNLNITTKLVAMSYLGNLISKTLNLKEALLKNQQKSIKFIENN